MNNSKRFLMPLATLFLTIAILICGVEYRAAERKIELLRTESANGQYTLVVYQVGDANRPFGKSRCRFDLMQNEKRVARYSFDMGNDGTFANAASFETNWNDDQVSIRIPGEEEGDLLCTMKTDGTFGTTMLEEDVES